MQTVNLNNLTTIEARAEGAPDVLVRADFPFTAATGNTTTSMVYFEIEPGYRLGTHTDSVEEIVVVLSGTVEATIGEERGQLSAGGAVLIPALVRHGVRNVGQEQARCIGFFSAAGVESVFDETVLPFGTKVMSTIANSTV